MRDKRFIAEHRGGSLSKDNHQKLIKWAVECSKHVLSLIDNDIDERLLHALHVAEEWGNENVKTGVAMKASSGAHTVARESSDPASIAVARSIGHAVATAHMADHAIGAALFALKAVKKAGQPIDAEREWQNEKLPAELMDIILSARSKKEDYFIK